MAEHPIRVAGDAQTQERSYHAFRYNVHPDSIDPKQPAKVEISREADGTGSLVAEFGTITNDPCYYNGSLQAAKDVDCILIWDEQTESYVLHRLQSFNKMTRSMTKPAPLKSAINKRLDSAMRASSPINRSRSSSPANLPPPRTAQSSPQIHQQMQLPPKNIPDRKPLPVDSDADTESGEEESSGESEMDDMDDLAKALG